MNIRNKHIVTNLIVGVLVAILGMLAVGAISAIEKEYQELTKTYIPHGQLLRDIRFAASRLLLSTIELSTRLQYDQASGTDGPLLRRKYTDLRHEAVVRLRETSAMLQRQVVYESHDVQLQREILSRIEALIAASDALVYAADRRAASTIAQARERFEREEQSFFQVLESDMQADKRVVVSKQAALEQRVSEARQWILLLAVLVLLLAVGAGMITARNIIGRVEQLRQTASRYAHAEDPDELTLPGGDELGDLAAALHQMAGDLRQSRRDIADGRDFLYEIINSMADSLVVLDASGTIILVNAATHAMLGYEEELIGCPFAKIMHDPPLQLVTEEGLLSNREAEYVGRGERKLPVAFSCSVLWNPDSSLRGFVCVAIDISQIKDAEAKLVRFADELQLNNEELRNFAYIVSHDLRAPLVNIKGFAGELQMLLQDLNGRIEPLTMASADREWLEQVFRAESEESLGFINSSVSRMEGLIVSLLKLSRYGQAELLPEEVDTGTMVRQLADTMEHQLVGCRAKLVIGELPRLLVDRGAMEQIVANLLDNAVKYLEPTRPGLIEVDATVEDGWVTLRVADNGRGIAQSDMGKIFDIFRRAGRHDVPGEGMGLAYVRTLVKRLGGQIWCESTLGVGTTFNVTLPCSPGAGTPVT